MAGNSQNCPTVHFSHGHSRMHGKLGKVLTKRIQSLHNGEYYTVDSLNTLCQTIS